MGKTGNEISDAAKASGTSRFPKRVRLQREMVHTDLTVSDGLEHPSSELVKSAFFIAGRKVRLGKAPLTGFDGPLMARPTTLHDLGWKISSPRSRL